MISQPPALMSVPRANERRTIEQPATDNMADDLALVAQLALKNLWDILSAPNDYNDGPLLRAKNAAAQTALNAQLRADENRLQQQGSADTLKKLLEMIAQEEKRIPSAVKQSQVVLGAEVGPENEQPRTIKPDQL